MEGNRDAKHGFELPAGLLTSNTPLPYESRAALKGKLEHLESGFEKLAGQPYGDDIPLICLPQSVHPLFTSMVPERYVLRSIRHLPDEVLQQVFLFSCFDSEGKHNDQALRRLCSVDRRWREAAINRCLLWTSPPPLHLDGKGPEDVRRVTAVLELYLIHSGTLPITFELAASKPPIRMPSDVLPIREALTLLLQQSHRWERAVLKLPSFGLKQIQESIKGPLPFLYSLDVLIPPFAEIPTASGSVPGLDIFCNAPNLRELSCDSSFGWMSDSLGPLDKVPHSQLEIFKSISQDDRNAYCDILDCPSPELRSVECACYSFETLPASKFNFLPKVTVLRLRAYEFLCDIASHLETLTLPALLHLEVRCSSPQTLLAGLMYTGVQTLVRQSGCSLERLSLSSGESSPAAFTDILALSPNLVELDITFPDTESLTSLTLDTSPEAPPVVPKLKTLIFRSPSTWHWSTSDEQGQAFVKMLASRTTALLSEKGESTQQALQEVILLYPSAITLFFDLPSKIAHKIFEKGENGEPAILGKRIDYWTRYMLTAHYRSRKDWFNPKVVVKFERFMRRLEAVNLKGDVETHTLMAYGMPTFLRELEEMEGGKIPGDRVFRFRSRAKRLLAKWKPFLLRDARKYRWCHYSDGTARMRWDTGDCEFNDEEIWDDVIGLEPPRSRRYYELREWR
ncbi:hypothetical protein DFP72DRAFT_916430 [Ephemerocybe angulata]|uniref:F-box domain-containing protein n=1 Tax=Ephemerocybe angulata TaxID=980116 RepID=A0A8H6HKA7_9AGAR|nr:hypothetical protein DFP72DRAFT_916430 [Tulosesus angulatus]